MIKVISPEDAAFDEVGKQFVKKRNFNFENLAEQITNKENLNNRIVVKYPIISISNLVYALARRGLKNGEHYNLIRMRPTSDNQVCIIPSNRASEN